MVKRIGGLFFSIIFLIAISAVHVSGQDPSTEINQLKKEVQKLLQRIEELEKKQAEMESKTVKTEKKVTEVEKKAERTEKKSLKDRVNLSGEARFRIVRSTSDTNAGFYGNDHPSDDIEAVDETYFPLRVRLNAHAEVVPGIADFYARLTMNKNFGLSESSLSDPLDNPNSFEASKGHDMTPRFEQAYTTIKIPLFNTTWYIGRLPGLDGPPSRQAGSLFPRLFIDAEIDGSLIKWDAPHTALDNIKLPWTSTRLFNNSRIEEVGRAFLSRKAYESKIKDRTGIILGYLKYDEKKESLPDDADVYLAQAQVKIGKDTAIVVDGLYMDDWHIPNTSNDKDVPDFKTPYWLTGFYADTQLLGFQIYGAYYYSHFKIPDHSWVDNGTTYTFDAEGFPGRIWYLGFNSGDLISPNMQLCVEYAKGDDAWINPFNYRGFRRKGTVQSPANNYFYNESGTNTIVGFYPFHAGVWDIYYDYFYHEKLRFRLGLMDFQFYESGIRDGNYSILGSNKFEHTWYPYFEVNISF